MSKLKADAENLPATQKMLMGVKKELKHDIASLEAKMNSGFQRTDSKIEALRSEFEGVRADIQHLTVNMEIQTTHMKLLLDSHSVINDRMNRLEGGAI